MKIIGLLLLLLLIRFPEEIFSQHLTTDELIKAWRVDDTSQTTKLLI